MNTAATFTSIMIPTLGAVALYFLYLSAERAAGEQSRGRVELAHMVVGLQDKLATTKAETRDLRAQLTGQKVIADALLTEVDHYRSQSHDYQIRWQDEQREGQNVDALNAKIEKLTAEKEHQQAKMARYREAAMRNSRDAFDEGTRLRKELVEMQANVVTANHWEEVATDHLVAFRRECRRVEDAEKRAMELLRERGDLQEKVTQLKRELSDVTADSAAMRKGFVDATADIEALKEAVADRDAKLKDRAQWEFDLEDMVTLMLARDNDHPIMDQAWPLTDIDEAWAFITHPANFRRITEAYPQGIEAVEAVVVQLLDRLEDMD